MREEIEAGLRYQKQGSLDRALERYEAAARHGGEPEVVAEALCRQSTVHRMRCEWEQALEAARRSASVAGTAGLSRLRAEALNAEAAVFQSRGDFPSARRLLEEVLTTTQDPRLRGIALQNLGSIAAQSGQLQTAELHFRESYGCFQCAGYRWGEAFALNNLAAAAMDRGDLELAEGVLDQAIALAREVEDLELLAIATKNQAEVLAGRGKCAEAEETASAALGFFAQSGNTLRQVECFQLLGDVNAQCGQCDDAANCYEHGARLAQEIGATAEVTKLRERLARVRRRGGRTAMDGG